MKDKELEVEIQSYRGENIEVLYQKLRGKNWREEWKMCKMTEKGIVDVKLDDTLLKAISALKRGIKYALFVGGLYCVCWSFWFAWS